MHKHQQYSTQKLSEITDIDHRIFKHCIRDNFKNINESAFKNSSFTLTSGHEESSTENRNIENDSKVP